MSPVANTTLNSLQSSVRHNALASFEYFVNTVLGMRFCEGLCTDVQNALVGGNNLIVYTDKPKQLASAISSWIAASRGVAVLSTVEPPKHEILDWLQLLPEQPSHNRALSVVAHQTSVEFIWV